MESTEVAGPTTGAPRYLHVKVVESEDGGHAPVNVRMPIGIVKWGMKMGQAFSPQMKEANLDWESIAAMIDSGAVGEIVHVEDEERHRTVDVWVD